MEKTKSKKEAIPAILLGKHHDISAFASEDDTRPYICGIRYNAERKRIEATNGASAILVPVEESHSYVKEGNSIPESCTIPVYFFKKCIRSIPKQKLAPMLENAMLSTSKKSDHEIAVNMEINDVDSMHSFSVISDTEVFSKWLDLDPVIKANEQNAMRISLKAGELKKIADYAAKCGEHKEGTPIHFVFDKSEAHLHTVVEFEIPIPSGRKAKGGLMPMKYD